MLKPSATKTASQYLTMMIKKGWPITRDEVFKFYNYGEEMMVQNSVIFKGQRIFVPTEMRHTLIKRSHSVHQGIDTSIRRARNSLFWHSMSADIKAKVENWHMSTICRQATERDDVIDHILSQPDLGILSAKIL